MSNYYDSSGERQVEEHESKKSEYFDPPGSSFEPTAAGLIVLLWILTAFSSQDLHQGISLSVITNSLSLPTAAFSCLMSPDILSIPVGLENTVRRDVL